MKNNKIYFLLGIALTIIASWLFVNNKKGTISEELRDFAFADTASITKIFLADKADHTILLEKVSPGEWRVNHKFKAKPSAINILLYTIRNLAVQNPVGKPAQENIIKRLAVGAVKVEIYVGDELKKLYYVGGETQDQLGTYMLLADPVSGKNSSVPFEMHIPGFNGYLTPRYFTSEIDWQEHIVFAYIPSEIKSVKVEIPPKPEFSFEVLALGDNKYDIKKLSNNKSVENFDTLALKQYLSYYQSIHYGVSEKILTDKVKDSIMNSLPMHIITVRDSRGIENKVRLFAKAAANPQPGKLKNDVDQMYARLNNEKDLVLVQYFAFGKLLPTIESFKKQ